MISSGGFSSLGNGQSGICQFDENRATGAERALAILHTGGQKRASGMPVGNTNSLVISFGLHNGKINIDFVNLQR